MRGWQDKDSSIELEVEENQRNNKVRAWQGKGNDIKLMVSKARYYS